jgi:hypothetical protein
MLTGKNRPKTDGTYTIEFKTAAGAGDQCACWRDPVLHFQGAALLGGPSLSDTQSHRLTLRTLPSSRSIVTVRQPPNLPRSYA